MERAGASQAGRCGLANPNLDVAYSEAWVAVDESSCTIVSVPKVEGRYYTVHFLNGWGETIANINERLFPKRPFGEFAMCLRGANVAVPAGATRIDLPVKYSRVLARVELGSDPDAAIALQHQFKFRRLVHRSFPKFRKRRYSSWRRCRALRPSTLHISRSTSNLISMSGLKRWLRKPVQSPKPSRTPPSAPVSIK